MCRIAAYLGPEIVLERFLLAPPHNLVEQAKAPREMYYGRLNGDGFGFGWYGLDGTPETYINPQPIWADANLGTLARNLRGDLWMASVRSATPGFGSTPANTQPFRDDDLLFLHNGFVDDFRRSVRPKLLRELAADIEADVCGDTDSEYLFALLRQILAEDEDMAVESAIGETLALIDDWAGETAALLNLIVSDGERVYAVRHAVNHDSPSLYYCVDDEDFPDGAQLVASEALTEQGLWQPLPEHSLLILDPESPPELIAL
ncbi:ergothioneine biosynthesis protein EgtC [Acidihalobacter prosperus]